MEIVRLGSGIKKSTDLTYWQNCGQLIILGQEHWEWAKGRITAGTILDFSEIPGVKRFFHGSGPLSEQQGDFDKNSSIGIAWSNDLFTWEWPGKQ